MPGTVLPLWPGAASMSQVAYYYFRLPHLAESMCGNKGFESIYDLADHFSCGSLFRSSLASRFVEWSREIHALKSDVRVSPIAPLRSCAASC